jgi:predicted nucleic acid-binding protein
MPKGYLFDTIACSRWRRGDTKLKRKVEALYSDVFFYASVISVGELILGIHKAPREYREKLRQSTEEMLSLFEGIFKVTR